jgi:hypothetical protein
VARTLLTCGRVTVYTATRRSPKSLDVARCAQGFFLHSFTSIIYGTTKVNQTKCPGVVAVGHSIYSFAQVPKSLDGNGENPIGRDRTFVVEPRLEFV